MILYRYLVSVDDEPVYCCKSMWDAAKCLQTVSGNLACVRDRTTGRPMQRGLISDVVSKILGGRLGFNGGCCTTDPGRPLHGREG